MFPDTTNLTKLFIRKAYTDINKLIEQQYTDKKLNNLIITGTPGVGKTMFMLYQLHVAKLKRRNVVLQLGEETWAFVSTPSVFVSDDQECISKLLCKQATLCFFDPHYTESKLKKRSVSFTIVFASTNPVH